MPVTIRSGGQHSSERTFQALMDLVRRVMQLAAIATIALYAYLLYGLFFGDIGQWATLKPEEARRIAENINGAILYLNIALGVLLVSLCFLFYDEEPFGYSLVGGSVALYYGVPFMIEMFAPGMVVDWQKSGNVASVAIFNQLKIAALMMAVPGGILTIRDLFIRLVDGGSRRKEEFSAMQYGGSVNEEENVGTPLLGIVAKCWQLPYCRPAIRKGCPIYHARVRCWKERVGCMCEENVIRHAMDALIGKDLVRKEQPDVNMESSMIAGLTLERDRTSEDDQEKTAELPSRTGPPPSPRNVKIPHNPNIPMRFKIERCRNCVIYNEHQRMKYQFFAPLMVLSLPGFTIWQFEAISNGLNRLLGTADALLARLSLTGSGASTSLGAIPAAAQYIILGCIVVIGTTMILRAMEVVIFRWKV